MGFFSQGEGPLSNLKARIEKIVAVGGGWAQKNLKRQATLEIDREIVRLSGRRRPSLLFIPTASSDDEGYCRAVERHFGQGLGCRVTFLWLVREHPAAQEMREKILGADIIYVGGGNTLKMMGIWRRHGVDRLLWQALRRGTVLSGLSAGSICWFRYGNSDSRKKHPRDKTLIRVAGLGMIPVLNCPHYDGEAHRRGSLKQMMKRTREIGLAVEDHCAVIFLGDRFRIISSRRGKKAYKVYWQEGRYCEEPILPGDQFHPIEQLLKKGEGRQLNLFTSL